MQENGNIPQVWYLPVKGSMPSILEEEVPDSIREKDREILAGSILGKDKEKLTEGWQLHERW